MTKQEEPEPPPDPGPPRRDDTPTATVIPFQSGTRRKPPQAPKPPPGPKGPPSAA